MATLLEKAKAIPGKRSRRADVTQEEIEVMAAWLNGKVGTTQIEAALGVARASFYCWVARCLKVAVSRGVLEIKVKGDEK